MEKRLFFVGGKNEIFHLIDRARSWASGENVFIVTRGEHLNIIRKNGFKAVLVQDYVGFGGDSEIKRQAVVWLEEWTAAPLAGPSLRQRLIVDDVNLWWFMLPVLFPDLLRCIYFIEAIVSVVEREQPDVVVLMDVRSSPPYPFRAHLDADLPGRVIAAYCETHGQKVCFVPTSSRRRIVSSLRHKWARMLMAGYYAMGRTVIAAVRKRVMSVDDHNDGNHPTVLVLSSPVYWREVRDDNENLYRDDAIVGSTGRVLAERGYRLIGLDFELNRPRLNRLGSLREKARSRPISWRAAESYFGGGDRRLRYQRQSQVRGLGRVLPSLMAAHMTYKGVRIGGLVSGRLHFLFDRHLPEVLQHLEVVETAIRRERPALMISVYEEGSYGRAATVTGSRLGVPTLALQHGTLSTPYVPAYYFKKVSTDTAPDPVSCPVPTCTAVYGEKTRQMLTQVSSYPEANVEVIGMPAADSLLSLLNSRDRSTSRESLLLDPARPLIMVASQPLNGEDRRYFAETILQAVKSLNFAQWVVKLHPGESVDAWDADLRCSGLSDRVSVFTGRLHDLILACDVLVSWFSTTILEAGVFSRPVVALHVPGTWAPEDYLRDGLAVGVRGSIELITELKRALAGDVPVASEEELEPYLYKLDGRSSIRAADLVERMIAAKEPVHDCVAEASDAGAVHPKVEGH